MATALGNVLYQLRRSCLRQDEAGVTDGELLDRFIARRDECAFEGLLRRHGPMVLGVCGRVLGNQADAEDAFQATFLVLVRKAGCIRPRGMVGNWLYGVAHTTALKARAMNSKRTAKERAAARPQRPAGAADGAELHALLDRELQGLPDRYRAAIVLCDLEGKTQKDAARELGCPLGTVGTRLVRGRTLLARRLTRHGMTFSGAAIAGLIAEQTAMAGVPPLLLSSTALAAALVAAGETAHGVISAKVAALTKGVLAAMLIGKLKLATAMIVAVAALGVAMWGMGGATATADPPAAQGASRPLAAQEKPAAAAAGNEKKTDDVGEAINHIWITNNRVQEELRLTEAQVKKILAIRLEISQKHAAERKEAEAETKKQNYARARAVSRKIQDDERKAFAEAAPQMLSAGALKRLRQIQRQARGMHGIILEPAIQKRLKLDDEQLKQVETILKEGTQEALKENSKRITPGGVFALTLEDGIALNQKIYAGAMKKVVAVFTPEQQRIWNDLVGEPFAFQAAAPK